MPKITQAKHVTGDNKWVSGIGRWNSTSKQ